MEQIYLLEIIKKRQSKTKKPQYLKENYFFFTILSSCLDYFDVLGATKYGDA